MRKRNVVMLLLTVGLLVAGTKGTRADRAPITSVRVAASAKLSPAELMPATVVSYLEFNQPAKLIDTVMNHPIKKKIETLEPYKQAMKDRKLRQARIVLAVIEASTGMDIVPTLKTISGGGIALGLDAATKGGVAIFKANDAKKLAEFRDALFDLARQDAENKGKPDPFRAVKYRGVDTYGTGNGGFAIVGPWLIVTNNPKLGHRVLDAIADGGNTLGASPSFKAARGKAGIDGDTMAWTWSNLDAMRDLGMAKPLQEKKLKDPGQELLFGPLHQAAVHASEVIGSLRLSDDAFSIRLSTPMDKSEIGNRAYALGEKGQAKADKPFVPKNTIMTLTTHKDLATYWNLADELFNENQAAQLAKSDSDLSTLFAGQSFSSEILPSLHPQMQVIVTRQKYAKGGKQPSMKLPAGALVFRAKDPKQLKTRAIVAYQSIIGFMNITAAQQNRPAMIMKTETLKGEGGADGMLLSASYVDGGDAQAAAGGSSRAMGSMYLNFSPSVALAGDYLFICSSRDLAAELATLAKSNKLEASPSNTAVVVNGEPGVAALRDNYKQLVAQNMLKEGHSMDEAEAQISLLLDLLSMISSIDGDFRYADGLATMEFGVKLAD